MQTTPGLFIVLEGVDGTGKSTQFELLQERLVAAGQDILTLHFPRYDEPSSYFIRDYLAGNYGTMKAVGPYPASLFYAMDRYQASFQIRQALAAGKIVLSNRFTGSNMVHQGTRFAHAEERRAYFTWVDNMEYKVLGIARPTLTFMLHTPLNIIEERLGKRDPASTSAYDADLEHIRTALEVSVDLCKLFPQDFIRIDAVRDGELLNPQAVNDLVWEKLAPLLPVTAVANTEQPARS